MNFSITALLLAIELGFVFFLARRSSRLPQSGIHAVSIYAFLLWVTTYGIVSSILGAQGFYISEEMLKLLPGLWLPLVAVFVCVLPVVFFKNVRNALREIVDTTPLHWLAYFHALRIGALGGAYKTHIGEFPYYFEYIAGYPDILFGISALWIGRKIKRGEIKEKTFMIWNLIGLFIIIPSSLIVLQLGLPGPLQVFTSLPDARAVFTYPMSIAPIIGVPLFVLINCGVAWRLWERSRSK